MDLDMIFRKPASFTIMDDRLKEKMKKCFPKKNNASY